MREQLDEQHRTGAPNAYFGDRGDWYAVLARTRDSDTLDRCNFDAALLRLGSESETVAVEEFSHWAVGWLRVILVDPADTDAVRIAQEIKDHLEDSLILDEDALSALEWEEHNEHHEKWQRNCEPGTCTNEDTKCEDGYRHGEPCGPEVYGVCRVCHETLHYRSDPDPFEGMKAQLALPGLERPWRDPQLDGYCSPECLGQEDDSRCPLEHDEDCETDAAA
jgi:hypothetical protein